MDELLINVYAVSNLHKAIIANLLADLLSKEADPKRGLQEFYNDIKHDLQTTDFYQEPDAETIRQRALMLHARLFQDIEVVLLRRGTLTEKGLVL